VTKHLKPGEDAGWLFLTEFGGRVDEGRFLKFLKRYVAFAGLTGEITLHSLRRYSLNRLSKTDLLGAQRIAGHKETKTTLLYTQLDAEHVRSVHERANVVEGIVTNKRRAQEGNKTAGGQYRQRERTGAPTGNRRAAVRRQKQCIAESDDSNLSYNGKQGYRAKAASKAPFAVAQGSLDDADLGPSQAGGGKIRAEGSPVWQSASGEEREEEDEHHARIPRRTLV
jgi:hypothetical protein